MIGPLLLLFFSAVVPQLLSFGGVAGSDVNWGKKVGCFVVDGTIVCPGCNYRAGLSCPRKLKDSQNCLLPPSTPPLPKTKPTPTPETTTYDEDEIANTTGSMAILHQNSTTLMESNEIQKEPTKTPIDMSIYLYRILGSKLPQYHRFQRDLSQQEEEEEEEEELEVCNWNGDCPCPLICCKTGPGCPKRCVMGIRLPPPWG